MARHMPTSTALVPDWYTLVAAQEGHDLTCLLATAAATLVKAFDAALPLVAVLFALALVAVLLAVQVAVQVAASVVAPRCLAGLLLAF